MGRLSGTEFYRKLLSLQQNNILKTVCKGILNSKKKEDIIKINKFWIFIEVQKQLTNLLINF